MGGAQGQQSTFSELFKKKDYLTYSQMSCTDTALTAPPQNYCAQSLFSKHDLFFWHVRAKKKINHTLCFFLSPSLSLLAHFACFDMSDSSVHPHA